MTSMNGLGYESVHRQRTCERDCFCEGLTGREYTIDMNER
jgi:hypothetical protein